MNDPGEEWYERVFVWAAGLWHWDPWNYSRDIIHHCAKRNVLYFTNQCNWEENILFKDIIVKKLNKKGE